MDVDLLKSPLIPYNTTQSQIGGDFEKFLHFPFIPFAKFVLPARYAYLSISQNCGISDIFIIQTQSVFFIKLLNFVEYKQIAT